MLKKEEVPKGIKKLTLSTSIRWFGWGLGEAFIPVFLLLFSVNFLEAGIFASIYHVLFFISIPLVGYLADNIKTKTMILAGLVIYVFIGMGYFLAGMTGAIIFIALSRGLNGISYSLDQIGRESYFMKNSSKKEISQIFGYCAYLNCLFFNCIKT
ncbi:MAG: MFS transporter [Nanoarchaeota archaeon]